jgi:hypothetical protein
LISGVTNALSDFTTLSCSIPAEDDMFKWKVTGLGGGGGGSGKKSKNNNADSSGGGEKLNNEQDNSKNNSKNGGKESKKDNNRYDFAFAIRHFPKNKGERNIRFARRRR